MIFKHLSSGLKVQDRDFDTIYPKKIRVLSEIHFTPVIVAQAAARFLAPTPHSRVLDVGSGAGKFCMIGSTCTKGFFTGVEQHYHLYRTSTSLSKRYNLANTRFIHGNVIDVEFNQFDTIYFFNSFYEHIFQGDSIDGSVALDKTLYTIYTQYMREQLSTMPIGTRLATFYSFMDEIPQGYKVVSSEFDQKLKLWEKVA
ncbi:MAG: SAM-dependent methyltransferase [Lewinellaceae bacterium]|jgi:SAM-dependent methyltransferase|nr:SAM-dependent methyltransferase [Lewinellaceae bacterium]